MSLAGLKANQKTNYIKRSYKGKAPDDKNTLFVARQNGKKVTKDFQFRLAQKIIRK